MPQDRNDMTSTSDAAPQDTGEPATTHVPGATKTNAFKTFALKSVECPDFRAVFARSANLARSYYRCTGDGDEFLGLGIAWRGSDVETSDDSISTQFRALRDSLVASETSATDDGVLRDNIRLLGWSAFDPDYASDPDSNWSQFSRRELYVPQVLLHRQDGETTAFVVGETEEFEAIWKRWETLISATNRDLQSGRLGTSSSQSARHLWLDRDTFCRGVERVTKDKVAPKVVLARRVILNTEDSIDIRGALSILQETYPTCTRFAISSPQNRDYPIFIGATPERLAQVEDGVVHTMALAGTTEATQGDTLLKSSKDRDEHQFVVDMILNSLKPCCSELNSDATPAIKRLANVSHLLSEISGTLRPDIGLADVVDALHPTPAVCGTPRELARDLIAEFEGFDRGLYAGAFGWMDLQGDGEFDVALRCALTSDTKAMLFAGAGITRDSEIELEWAETHAKFEPLLHALTATVFG